MIHKFRIPLWNATAIADNGTLTSPGVPLRFADLESLIYTVTSVGSTAKVKIEWAGSLDNVTYGGFGDHPPLISDTSTQLANVEGVHEILGITFGFPWVKFKVTDLAATGDSLVTVTCLLREKV